MHGLRLKTTTASVLWVEPHRIQAGGKTRPLEGIPPGELLDSILTELPQRPTAWIVDDQWAPSLLQRDIVTLPAGTEGREAFFRWKLSQNLALETPHSVQAMDLGEGAWLLVGIQEGLRENWMQASARQGRPMHSLLPRWLYLYNRLAPSRERPGMLLSLCPHAQGGFTGTLAAWGRTLTLLRQWSEPASPEIWQQERVLPTATYLQRESRPPQELWVWGADRWPDTDLPSQLILPEIPAQEAL